LDEELNRASRFGYPLSIVLITLEGHQHISRAYGTLKSEDTLRRAAQLIAGSVRKADIVTRHDAQSFALILPHTGEQVQVVKERLTEILGNWLHEENLTTGRAPITLCIGAAVSEGAKTTRAGLMSAASGVEVPVELAELKLAA
jgi:diguanylate cyclase (GGDEF)-like protein